MTFFTVSFSRFAPSRFEIDSVASTSPGVNADGPHPAHNFPPPPFLSSKRGSSHLVEFPSSLHTLPRAASP